MLMSKNELCKLFSCLADEIANNYDKIVSILCQIETKSTAKNEIDKTIRALKTYDSEDKYLKGMSPMGVVAVFLPFNMPLYSLVLYGFGALYAGNVVYVKPSRLTYEQISQIYNLLKSSFFQLKLVLVETGFNNGTSSRNFLYDALNKYKASVIIFTGQYSSMINIRNTLPKQVKLIYSGSGVCPLIIRESADLQLAVQIAVKSKLFNSGQDCLATEKIYVHEQIFDSFLNLLLEKLKTVKVGPNDNDDTDIGPLISKELADEATDIIKHASGQVILRGNQVGNIVYPSVIISTFDSEEFKTEKFAPIFVIAKYGNDNVILDDINSAEYCLGITVVGDKFSPGTFKAAHVEYNRSILEYEENDAHVPFGGYGKSGFVCLNGSAKEGPILFSIETSIKEGN